MTSLVINVPSEYISLGLVMQSALEQASKGKGRERHASEGESYEDQIICEVARRVGLGYPLGQAVKKIYESQRLIPQLGVQELLGAMNYLAAAVIVMQERMEEEGRRFREGFANSKTEGGCFQNGNGHSPESSAEPEFQRGDKVEVQMVPDSSTWASAAIMAVYRDKDSCEWRYCVDFDDGWTHVVVPSARVRPVSAPKAEGCEALVEKDAPQTPDELYDRIIANNPATFKARTPTGGELAEMAEEEPHG